MIGVGGRTGVGKTRVLRALAAKNHQVLDLEALAAHRGSAFGDLKGAVQPSNAAFEKKCAWAWRALDATRGVFVEDEEGHVGRYLVPQRSTRACDRRGASYASTRRTRLAHGALLEDYAVEEAAGAGGTRARLDAAMALVAKRLGPDDTARTKRYWTRATSRRARVCCWRGTTTSSRTGTSAAAATLCRPGLRLLRDRRRRRRRRRGRVARRRRGVPPAPPVM